MGQGISSWRYLLRNTPMCLNLSHWQDYEDELVTSSEKTQQARKRKAIINSRENNTCVGWNNNHGMPLAWREYKSNPRIQS